MFPFLAGDEEKKKKIPPRQYPVSNPPPWIPKPEVSVVSVQPQDSSIKDDDEVPYSSSDEEEMVTVNKFMSVKNALNRQIILFLPCIRALKFPLFIFRSIARVPQINQKHGSELVFLIADV